VRALVITERNVKAAEALLVTYQSMVECAEIRFDHLLPEEREKALILPSCSDLPLIATARLPKDGGVWKEGEEERIDLLRKAAESGFAFIDLEVDQPRSLLRNFVELLSGCGGRLIASFHDFTSFTDERTLFSRVEEAEGLGAIPKAAVMIDGSVSLLAFTRAALKLKVQPADRILVAMGNFGVPVRIAYRHFGSMLTFCAPAEKIAAPGQLSAEALTFPYALSRISEKSRLFGIIGNPVLHTRSPEIHNSAFRSIGFDGLYIPFPTDDTAAFMEIARLLEIGGFSVTVPFKEEIVGRLHEVDESVRAIGSCNTVFRCGHEFHGTNTDYDGFLAPLKARMGERGGCVLMIGAGGAARSVAVALRSLFDSVVVANRTHSRAQRLSEELLGAKGHVCSPEEANLLGPYRAVVQTTSVGMSPHIDDDPLPSYCFTGDELVYDIIYTPEKTHFLQRAETAGCDIIGGKEMLLGQAERQFELFTGLRYPKDPEHRENF